MAEDVVLAKSKRTGRVSPMSRYAAERSGAEILDESPFNDDGSLRRSTTASGRPAKPKTSLAKKASEKSAKSADDQAVTESASNEKE